MNVVGHGILEKNKTEMKKPPLPREEGAANTDAAGGRLLRFGPGSEQASSEATDARASSSGRTRQLDPAMHRGMACAAAAQIGECEEGGHGRDPSGRARWSKDYLLDVWRNGRALWEPCNSCGARR